VREGKVGKNTSLLSRTPRPLIQYELRQDNATLLFFTRLGGTHSLLKKNTSGSTDTLYLTEYSLKIHRSRKPYETEVVGTS
jgi:hypothetical protein